VRHKSVILTYSVTRTTDCLSMTLRPLPTILPIRKTEMNKNIYLALALFAGWKYYSEKKNEDKEQK
jgi:hypothetical protein